MSVGRLEGDNVTQKEWMIQKYDPFEFGDAEFDRVAARGWELFSSYPVVVAGETYIFVFWWRYRE